MNTYDFYETLCAKIYSNSTRYEFCESHTCSIV